MNPRDIYFIYDDSIPFKNDLELYPATMRDYFKFFIYSKCLLLEKNSVRDPQLALKTIAMSYLEYMYFVSENKLFSDNENDPVDLFNALLRLVLRLPEGTEIKFGYKDGEPVFIINDIVYDSSDFDLFRDIVSDQNELELPNELVQKNVRDAIEEARRYKAKINNQKMADLEDQIIAVSIYTGWDFNRIYDMTIRKFIRTLRRADHILHQKIYLAASLSGMVEFKDKSFIKSWLSDLGEKDNYDDVVMDVNKLENKVNFNEAKGK